MRPGETIKVVKGIIDEHSKEASVDAGTLDDYQKKYGVAAIHNAVASIWNRIIREISDIPSDIVISEERKILLWLGLRDYASKETEITIGIVPVHPKICAVVNKTLFAIAKVFEPRDIPARWLGLNKTQPKG